MFCIIGAVFYVRVKFFLRDIDSVDDSDLLIVYLEVDSERDAWLQWIAIAEAQGDCDEALDMLVKRRYESNRTSQDVSTEENDTEEDWDVFSWQEYADNIWSEKIPWDEEFVSKVIDCHSDLLIWFEKAHLLDWNGWQDDFNEDSKRFPYWNLGGIIRFYIRKTMIEQGLDSAISQWADYLKTVRKMGEGSGIIPNITAGTMHLYLKESLETIVKEGDFSESQLQIVAVELRGLFPDKEYLNQSFRRFYTFEKEHYFLKWDKEFNDSYDFSHNARMKISIFEYEWGRLFLSQEDMMYKKNRTISRWGDVIRFVVRQDDLSYENYMKIFKAENLSIREMVLSGNALGEFMVEIQRAMGASILRTYALNVTYFQLMEVAVACERYRLKNGELPESLNVLVPEFLDAVPLDAFDGNPLRYNREMGIAYSVGENLIDDGGNEWSDCVSSDDNVDDDEDDEEWNDYRDPADDIRIRLKK